MMYIHTQNMLLLLLYIRMCLILFLMYVLPLAYFFPPPPFPLMSFFLHFSFLYFTFTFHSATSPFLSLTTPLSSLFLLPLFSPLLPHPLILLLLPSHLPLCLHSVFFNTSLFYHICLHLCAIVAPTERLSGKVLAKTPSPPQHLALCANQQVLSVVARDEAGKLTIFFYKLQHFFTVSIWHRGMSFLHCRRGNHTYVC